MPFVLAALPWMAIERTTVGIAVVAGTGDHLRGRINGQARNSGRIGGRGPPGSGA